MFKKLIENWQDDPVEVILIVVILTLALLATVVMASGFISALFNADTLHTTEIDGHRYVWRENVGIIHADTCTNVVHGRSVKQ